MAWFLHTFFSFTGRTSRLGWWMALIVLMVVSFGGQILIQPELFTFDESKVVPPSLASKVFSLLLAVPAFAVTLKRLNDRSWGHWVFWLLVLCCIPIYIGPFFGFMTFDDPAKISQYEVIAILPLIPVSIWLFIDNGCLAGDKGPNRYGPDPLAKDAS